MARNRAVLIPVVIAAIVFLVLPFIIAIVIPAATGRPLGSDGGWNGSASNGRELESVLERARPAVSLSAVPDRFSPDARHGRNGACRPRDRWRKTGAHAGPLLATPLTTLELRLQKLSGHSCRRWRFQASGSHCTARYRVVAEPGVLPAMISPTTMILIFGRWTAVRAGVAADRHRRLVARERCTHGAAIRRPHRHARHRFRHRAGQRAVWLTATALGLIGLGFLSCGSAHPF